MTFKAKNLESLSRQLSSDTSLQEDFKKDPVAALQQVRADNPLETDKWIYRIVVFFLGATVVSIVVGVLCLMTNGDVKDGQIPTVLTALGSAAIGAIAGLLAPPPKNNNA